jgi:3-deoxy-D-arabino-heptulosonate 7-phosphate (DAHP) synthase
MSTNNQLEQQIQELVRVGVGGKYRTDKDYLKLIADELIHEQFMMQGGITRYRKQITDLRVKKVQLCMELLFSKSTSPCYLNR